MHRKNASFCGADNHYNNAGETSRLLGGGGGGGGTGFGMLDFGATSSSSSSTTITAQQQQQTLSTTTATTRAAAATAAAEVKADHLSNPNLSTAIARSAFEQGDVEASIQYHASKNSNTKGQSGAEYHSEEAANDAGYAGPVVLAGIAGATLALMLLCIAYSLSDVLAVTATATAAPATATATATAATAAASGDSLVHINGLVAAALALFAALGLCAGIHYALFRQNRSNWYHEERAREQWEMQVHFCGEVEEMVQIYEQKGLSKADAETIIGTLSNYKEAFLNHMMVEELHMMPPNALHNALFGGIYLMLSFVVCGVVPCLVLRLVAAATASAEQASVWALVTCLALLCALGVLKYAFVERGKRLAVWHAIWAGTARSAQTVSMTLLLAGFAAVLCSLLVRAAI
jgi:DNA damage-binding protein 1